jgi:hypothetical protein
MLKTLERKNPDGVMMETIASNAICPFHARILRIVRNDVVRLDDTVSEFFERARKVREEERERQRLINEKRRRYERWMAATTSDFSQKLRAVLKK